MINLKNKYIFAIDLGGTKIAIGIIDPINGQIIYNTQYPTPTNLNDTIATISNTLTTLAKQYEIYNVVALATAGFINKDTYQIEVSPNIHWDCRNIKYELKKILPQYYIYIENDANAATWGEYRFSEYYNRISDIFFIGFGTGIGGGIIINQKIYYGYRGIAGEFGHMIIHPNGIQCTCGQKGCWERYASAKSIVNKAHEMNIISNSDNRITLTEANIKNSVKMQELLEYITDNICYGLINISTIFDPSIIIIGGGLVHVGDLLLDAIIKKYHKLVYKNKHSVKIHYAKHDNDAGIIGVANLAYSYIKTHNLT